MFIQAWLKTNWEERCVALYNLSRLTNDVVSCDLESMCWTNQISYLSAEINPANERADPPAGFQSAVSTLSGVCVAEGMMKRGWGILGGSLEKRVECLL